MIYEYNITNKNYHTLDFYLKQKYSKKVFKVALNASFTCPNRDGSKGKGGCLFCSAKGSGDFAGNPFDSLETQFEKNKEIISSKWKDAYYIVYFQAFSNTYGTLEKLKKTFDSFIGKENVIGMSIATRCDCITPEIIDYLIDLKKNFKEFWIEMGLQTTNINSMKRLNLCYTFDDYKKATKMLNDANISIVTHIIDGLPFEKEKDMLKTIKDINKLPIDGIKIHYLNVINNTEIANWYNNGLFETLELDNYINIVSKQISLLKDNIIIHRIGADSNEKDLIAPKWIRNKLSIMDKIDNYLFENNIFQGDLYK